jgi:hypothetical protein
MVKLGEFVILGWVASALTQLSLLHGMRESPDVGASHIRLLNLLVIAAHAPYLLPCTNAGGLQVCCTMATLLPTESRPAPT